MYFVSYYGLKKATYEEVTFCKCNIYLILHFGTMTTTIVLFCQKKKLIMLFHQNFKFSIPIAQDSQMTVNVKYLYMQLSIISTIRIR